MNLDHKNTHNKQEWMFNNYYNTSKNQHKVFSITEKQAHRLTRFFFSFYTSDAKHICSTIKIILFNTYQLWLLSKSHFVNSQYPFKKEFADK